MAQRTEIVFTDDLDGGPAEGTVTFGIDGTTYEIDLSRANAEKLAKAVGPYVEAGRKVSGGARRRGKAGTGGRHDLSAVREWAREEGLRISDRGRIPADVVAKYKAAH
jgi:hypothetical protein